MSNPKSTRHNENQILNMFGELGDTERKRDGNKGRKRQTCSRVHTK